MSWKRVRGRLEGKYAILFDGALNPRRGRRLLDDVNRTSKNPRKSFPDAIHALKMSETAAARRQPHSQVYVGPARGFLPRRRAKQRQLHDSQFVGFGPVRFRVVMTAVRCMASSI